MTLTIIMINGVHWTRRKKHLGSSELSASFFVTWSTLLASLGGFYWKCQNFIFNFNFILHMAFKIFRDVIGYSQSDPENIHKESQISWYLQQNMFLCIISKPLDRSLRLHCFKIVARQLIAVSQTIENCFQFWQPQCPCWIVNVYKKGWMFTQRLLHLSALSVRLFQKKTPKEKWKRTFLSFPLLYRCR